MREYQNLVHTIDPLYRSDSSILILGSFPSAKSREAQFFYGHPQNRFWKVISLLTEQNLPQTTEEKKKLLYTHKIALWDVIKECDIIGSDDSSIQNVVPNDICRILNDSNIKAIYTNGNTAGKLYSRFQQQITGVQSITLPSTSPANASYNLERLCVHWKQILQYL